MGKHYSSCEQKFTLSIQFLPKELFFLLPTDNSDALGIEQGQSRKQSENIHKFLIHNQKEKVLHSFARHFFLSLPRYIFALCIDPCTISFSMTFHENQMNKTVYLHSIFF